MNNIFPTLEKSIFLLMGTVFVYYLFSLVHASNKNYNHVLELDMKDTGACYLCKEGLVNREDGEEVCTECTIDAIYSS